MIATIRTAIQINDMMSQQFHAMNMAMSSVIDSFETLHDQTGKAVDVSSLQNAQRELHNVESNFNQIENEIKQAEQAQGDFNNEIKNAHGPTDQLASKFIGLAAAVGSALAIGSAVKGGWDRLIGIDTAEAKLQALGHSTQSVEVIMNNALESVSGTAFRLEDAVNTAASAVAAGVQPGQQLERYLSLTADAAAIAGVNLNEMGAIFNKVTTSGMIQAMELNQMADRGIPIFQMLAEEMGVTAQEVRKLASDGEISAQMFLNAVESGFGGAAQAMGTASFQATMDNIGAAIDRIGASFLNGAGDGQGFFDQVKPLMVDLLETLRSFEPYAAAVGQVFGEAFMTIHHYASMVFGFFVDNWSMIGPIVMGVAGALFILTTYMIAAKTWTLITTGAWALLNAVMAANPIIKVIMAIMLLIAVFSAVIGTINHFAGTSISATGIVAGVFFTLGAFIYNIVAYLWGIFASIAEFFVNVWNHPMYSVKRLFYNLATNVLDQAIVMTSGWDSFATSFVNAIIWAVNGAIKAWNKFIDILPDGVSSFLDLGKGTELSYRSSITSDLQGIKNSLGDWLGEAPEDYWEAPKMDPIALGDAWDYGYDWGANLFSGFEFDMPEGIELADDGYQDILGELEAGNLASKDTAGNTKKMADSVNMATEDLKYLRDLSEREAINRYTTSEIKVDMKNENHINSEMDIDGVIDRFGERVEEVAEILAEGDSIV